MSLKKMIFFFIGIIPHLIYAQWNGTQTNSDVGIGIYTYPGIKLHVDGYTKFVNHGERNLMIESDDNDSWLTFHDPGQYWYSLGIDRSDEGKFKLNAGGNLGSVAQFVLRNDGNVGISNSNPWEKLHVDGSVGIGKFTSTPHAGLQIYYTDGGSGTTVFKHQRWGGDFYFNRNDANGERTQVHFGGAGNHYMDIYNYNNEINIRLNTAGNSYLNGGNVGIGTTSPDAKLSVKGTIHAEEVKVDLSVPGPDYVFEKDYALTSLEELKSYIDQNKHLPEIPSAKEMEEEGINLKEMNLLLLKKIEEITLYMIELNRREQLLNEENGKLKSRVDKLEINLEKE